VQRRTRASKPAASSGLPTVVARRHGDLVPVAADVLVSASIGPSGEAVALWSTPPGRDALLARSVNAGGASFPDAAPGHPMAARVTFHTPNRTTGVVAIPALQVAHPDVQPLPDGRVVVVGARCRWRPDGPDRNAVVYDPAGELLAEGTLGDGIEHMLTTPDGAIWVGYFDEGVYGNYGWGGRGREPIGRPGIVRFTNDLQVAWRYGAEFGFVMDCYALNVVGETAWACYYSEFPIVRMGAAGVTGWHNQVRGPQALVVAGQTVALVGGYDSDHDRVVVGTLAGEHFQPQVHARLRLPGGVGVQAARLVGRGSELHVLAGTAWSKIALEDLIG
jgi:hypothetical protein